MRLEKQALNIGIAIAFAIWVAVCFLLGEVHAAGYRAVAVLLGVAWIGAGLAVGYAGRMIGGLILAVSDFFARD